MIFLCFSFYKSTLSEEGEKLFCQNYRTVILFSLEKLKLWEEGEIFLLYFNERWYCSFSFKKSRIWEEGGSSFVNNQTVILPLFIGAIKKSLTACENFQSMWPWKSKAPLKKPKKHIFHVRRKFSREKKNTEKVGL